MRTTILAALFSLLAATASAEIIFVDVDAAGGNDGTSWRDAYVDLQDALVRVVAGDEIWVAEGVYYPSQSGDQSRTFEIISGVGLYGGFAGGERTRTKRDWRRHRSVLSGALADDISTWSEYAVTFNQCDPTTHMDGFTVERARNGIYIVGAAPEIWNSTIQGCRSSSTGEGGTGIIIADAKPRIQEVRIADNVSSSTSGGIEDASLAGPCFSRPKLVNVLFEGNVGQMAGGMRCNGQLTNVEFRDNRAVLGVGGLWTFGDRGAILDRVTFTGNHGNRAGGLWTHSPGKITDVHFVGNSIGPGSQIGAGGMLVAYDGALLINVVFQDNTGRWGGGLALSKGGATIVNAVFAGNHAYSSGGGLYAGLPMRTAGKGVFPVTISGSTFFDNAVTDGWPDDPQVSTAAVFSRGGSLSVSNTIVYGNQRLAGSGPPIFALEAPTVISHSLVSGCGGSGSNWQPEYGLDGGGNLDQDPLFLDPGVGDVHLTVGSPVINAGDTSSVPDGIVEDLDGNPRICRDAVDMGAYEFQGPSVHQIFALRVSPQTLNLGAGGKWVATELSAVWNIGIEQIDPGSLQLMAASAATSELKSGALVSKFWRQDVGVAIPVGMEVPVILSGVLLDGMEFTATDTIGVIDPGRSRKATTRTAYPAGALATVEWFAIYGDTDTEYDGYISTDSGLTWELLFEGLRGMNKYSWTLDAEMTGTAEVLVEARSPQGVYHAMTQQFSVDGVAVEADEPPTTRYSVSAAPNPFNPQTTLSYSLPIAGRAELVIYDLAGRRVKSLVSGHVAAGQHEAQWDGRDEHGRRVASGVYLYRLVASGFSETKRLVLLK